jgi:hypothetical protein
MRQAILAAVASGLLLGLTGADLAAQRPTRYSTRYPTGTGPTTTGTSRPTAAGKVVARLTLSTGSQVQLTLRGNGLTGSGAMTSSVTYPMTATGGQIQGSYLTVVGTIKGREATVPFKLVINRASGYGVLILGSGGSSILGRGTWVVQP